MSDSIFYAENGDVVQEERWKWVAEYTDGSYLHQFDLSDNRFHRFAEIDQSRLRAFWMVSDTAQPIVILWKPEYKLIHFYRQLILHIGGPDYKRVQLYCFGYQVDSIKNIFVILPDDRVFVVDDVSKLDVE